MSLQRQTILSKSVRLPSHLSHSYVLLKSEGTNLTCLSQFNVDRKLAYITTNTHSSFPRPPATMPPYAEGSTVLTCRALLEHPRQDPHSLIAVIFDAILHGAAIANGDPIICCSFRYVRKTVHEHVNTGIYDITVIVSDYFFSLSSSSLHSSSRLLAFNREPMNPVQLVQREIFLSWVIL